MVFINPSIFRAYDIRGKYPEELDEKAAEIIARSFARFLGKENPNIVIARDTRESSNSLAKAVSQGLVLEGANVIYVGLATTSMLQWLVWKEKFDAGIMVTASHLPPEWNGLKFYREQGKVVAKSFGFEEIIKIIESQDFSKSQTAKGEVKKPEKDFVASYISFLCSRVSGIKPLKVVIDGANSVAPIVLAPLLVNFKQIEARFLCFEPGGELKHEANPHKEENLADIKAELQKDNYDFGVAFDGDADRAVFLTSRGERIQSALITALLAQCLLEKNPGRKIIVDATSSRIVEDVVTAAGGSVIRTKTGHSWMHEAMTSRKALFGGEHSGHYFFEEMGYGDGAILAFLKVCELLSQHNASLEELLKPLQKYVHSGEMNIPFAGDTKAVFAKIEAEFSDAQISKLDGIAVNYPDWWFILRSSATEPVLRLNIEARTEDILRQKKELIERILH